MMGIYKIECLINGRVYIGQSINIEQRWKAHKATSRKGNFNAPLYYEMRRYGVNNFSFEVLEECLEEELNEKEIYYIKKYNSYIGDIGSNGYNRTRGGSGTKKLTPEERQERINKIVSLWENGNSITKISEETSIDRKDVIECLKANCDNYSHKESMKRGRDPTKRKVDCYTLWGDYIQTFSSVTEAANYFHTRRDHISRSCGNNGARTSLNYRFTYEKEEKVLEFKGTSKNRKNTDYVFKLTSNDQIIYINGKVELSRFLHKRHDTLLSIIDKDPNINGWHIEYKIF